MLSIVAQGSFDHIKIVVTVPQNARTGLITLSGSTGSVTSLTKFTVL